MNTRIETIFAVLTTYGYQENYAFTEDNVPDGENPYWKNKGNHVVELPVTFTVAQAQIQNEKSLDQLAEQLSDLGLGERHDGAIFTYCGTTLEERSENTLDIVYTYLKSDESYIDYGFARYCAYKIGLTEQGFDWAMNILRAREVLDFEDEPYSTVYITFRETN